MVINPIVGVYIPIIRKDVDTNLIPMTVSKHWDRTREFQQACDSDWWNGWVNENNIFVLKSHLCRTSFPKALHFFALHHHVKISNMLLRQAPTSPAFFKCIKFVPFTRSPFLIACTALKKSNFIEQSQLQQKQTYEPNPFQLGRKNQRPPWYSCTNFHRLLSTYTFLEFVSSSRRITVSKYHGRKLTPLRIPWPDGLISFGLNEAGDGRPESLVIIFTQEKSSDFLLRSSCCSTPSTYGILKNANRSSVLWLGEDIFGA